MILARHTDKDWTLCDAIPLDTPYNLNLVALAPDGRRVAFTAGRTAFEIWTMEGFLPR